MSPCQIHGNWKSTFNQASLALSTVKTVNRAFLWPGHRPVIVLTPPSRQHRHSSLRSNLRGGAEEMTRKEMRAAAYEKLIEATKLLASAGLPLLAEEVEELALQVDLQVTN